MEQFKDYKQFLVYMDNNYDEKKQLIIEDFISYYINKYRGFGHHNYEDVYKDNLKHDINGDLHKFALIGFDFKKKIHDARKLKK